MDIAEVRDESVFVPPELDIVHSKACEKVAQYFKSPTGILVVKRYDGTPLGEVLEDEKIE